MYWVVISKAFSALSILVQVLVFGLAVSAKDAQAGYSLLAIIALSSQAAVALPILVTSQSVWLQTSDRKVQFRQALLLAITLALIGGGVAAFTTSMKSPPMLIIACILPAIASLGNIYATDRFASGDLKSGAVYNILNVVIPQAAAAVSALLWKNIEAWFIGLAAGHAVALLLIATSWQNSSVLFDSTNEQRRAPLKVSSVIVLSTYCCLIFSWSILNLPRITLEQGKNSIEVIQILLSATICFAISNSLETLTIQLRRAQWLRYLESGLPISLTNNLKNERMFILLIFTCSIFISSLLSYGFLLFIQNHDIAISFILLISISTVESCRGAISTLYNISECERTQTHLLSYLVLLVIAYCAIFVSLPKGDPEISYAAGAFIMCIFVGLILLQSHHSSNGLNLVSRIKNG